MVVIDLKEIERLKYNPWGKKKILQYKAEKNFQKALSLLVRKDLSPLVKSAYYFHYITECNGLEFYAYSDIQFTDKAIILPNDAILVPLFYNDLDGRSLADPQVHRTTDMMNKAEFVYDGWIPIDQWDEENVIKKNSKYFRNTINFLSWVFLF